MIRRVTILSLAVAYFSQSLVILLGAAVSLYT